jgi:hypothetical protein
MRKTGIDLIAEEREEHFKKHKLSVLEDSLKNTDKELIVAVKAILDEQPSTMSFPRNWDNAVVAKMANKSYKERLIIAGSLIAAEIDRLQLIEKK